jgi:hypothetical protein
LSLASLSARSPEKLEAALLSALKNIADQEKIPNIHAASSGQYLNFLIQKIAIRDQDTVAVLIDNYDSPILS